MTTQSEANKPPRAAELDMDVLVDFGRSLKRDLVAKTSGLSFTFQQPEAGWMVMTIVQDQNVVDWDLSNILDPFAAAPRPEDEGRFRTTFIHWLEDNATGRATDMAVDMEGWTGAILISPGLSDSAITMSVLTSTTGLDFTVAIERHVLVRDIYTALIAYWESDALNAAWSEWSSKPKWSLRSSIVENYLAASGSRI